MTIMSQAYFPKNRKISTNLLTLWTNEEFQKYYLFIKAMHQKIIKKGYKKNEF